MSAELSRRNAEISLDGVCMVFGKKGRQITVLQDITFDVNRNELLSLIGSPGCGKSTLLRLMADVLQPSSGQIQLHKVHPREVRLRRKFGIVSAQSALNKWRTVRENVELPLEEAGQSRSVYGSAIEQLLETVGLTKYQEYYPWQLSGGLQMRVAIARALSLDSQVLFLDEPFAMLDAFTKEKLQIELLDLQRKLDKTIVLVTNSIEEAVFLSDRIVVLSANPGRVQSIHRVDLGVNRPLSLRDSESFRAITEAVRSTYRAAAGTAPDSPI